MKDERLAASETRRDQTRHHGRGGKFVAQMQQALYASKISSYTQGSMLMRAASEEFGWHLKYGEIALMWRGGCIIRGRFLGKIKEAFDKNPDLANLLLDPYFKRRKSSSVAWRKVVETAVKGASHPRNGYGLEYYDSFRSARLPANLFRLSGTISAHTHTNAWTNRAANSFTPTGPAAAAKSPRALQLV